MKNNEKLTEPISFRVTKSQKQMIEEMGVNVREMVDYYIVHNTNPTLQLKNRQRALLRDIQDYETKLKECKEELIEVNKQLGVPTDENETTIWVSEIGERLKGNCKIGNKGKCNKTALANYVQSDKGQTIINNAFIEYNIRKEEDKEKFKRNILKYLKVDDVKFKH
ncbi:MAG: hypothetical protein IJX17_07470 [Clostridia bacterium]|nr:hypothetical protein [Clostridia bacterium]